MVDDKTDNEVTVPETERGPIVDGQQTYQHKESRWLHLFLYLITALIFAFFFVLAGRWAYHRIHHTSSVAPAPAGNNIPAEPSVKAPIKGSPQTKTNPPSGSSANRATNSTSPSAAATPSQTPQLPNNGPGDIVAIFIGASLIVGGTHFVASLYRDR